MPASTPYAFTYSANGGCYQSPAAVLPPALFLPLGKGAEAQLSRTLLLQRDWGRLAADDVASWWQHISHGLSSVGLHDTIHARVTVPFNASVTPAINASDLLVRWDPAWTLTAPGDCHAINVRGQTAAFLAQAAWEGTTFGDQYAHAVHWTALVTLGVSYCTLWLQPGRRDRDAELVP
jgi:hypothetical protein